MILRGAQLRPLEAEAGVGIVGVQADRLGVFDDGAVIVLLLFGRAGVA